MRDIRHATLVAAALALLCLVWGSTWLAIKVNLRDMPPLLAAAVRFLLAAFIILATAGNRRLPAASMPSTRFWVLLAGTMIAVPYACVYWGEQYVASGLTAVLFATYPLFVAVMAHTAVAGERLAAPLVAGLLSGFAGVVVLFSGDLGGDGPHALAGGLLILVAACASAVATILVRQRLFRLDPLLINLRPMFYGGLMLLAASLLTERQRRWHWSLPAAAALIYLAALGSVIAFAAYYWLMRTIAVSRLSFITYVTPLVALLLGASVAGEPLTLRVGLGTLLIIGGIVLARRTPAAGGRSGKDGSAWGTAWGFKTSGSAGPGDSR